jgi:3-hydroxymyristoyl/3-hydroxydecanoyl-(acyl carrier protein) dehydratase
MPSVQRLIAPDHPSFAGHFPGHPILPGVVLLAEVLEALRADPATAARLGPAPRLGAAKFLSPVGPGAALDITWSDAGARIRFDVHLSADRTLAASGQFEAVAVPAPEGAAGVA